MNQRIGLILVLLSLVTSPQAVPLIGAMPVLASEGKPEGSSTNRGINDVKAVYDADNNRFDVSGRADYPDGTMLYIALDYYGERLVSNRATVKDQRFSAVLTPQLKPLPAYYDVAVFIRNVSGAVKPSNGGQGLATATVRVGSPEAIAGERRQAFAFLNKAMETALGLYQAMMPDYQDCLAAKSEFDANAWQEKYNDALAGLRKSIKALKERKEKYLAPTLAESEVMTLAVLNEAQTIYREITDQLKKREELKDPHTGKAVAPESLKTLFDERFYNRYNPLKEILAVRCCLGQEYLILKELSATWQLYLECTKVYENTIGQADEAAIWTEFSEGWLPRAEKSRNALQALTCELVELKKTFPGVYNALDGLPARLIALHTLYDSYIRAKKDGINIKVYRETTAEAQAAFQEQVVGIFSVIGLPQLLPSVSAADSGKK